MNMSYTEDQRNEFVELAAIKGIEPARKELGFPGSWTTGKKWCDAAGVEIPLDALATRARAHYTFYTDVEKYLAAQALLNALYEKIESDSNMNAQELNQLANAVQRAIQTLQLLDGEATNRSEHITSDNMDLEIRRMLNSQRDKNDAQLAKLNSKQTD